MRIKLDYIAFKSIYCSSKLCVGAFLVAQIVKNLPACRRPRFDPRVGRSLEKGMATHFGILAWRIPWTVEPGGLQGYSPWHH